LEFAAYIAICYIWRKLSAQRQASAHRAIKSLPSAILSHSSAQSAQTAAQTPQDSGWNCDIRSIKSALVAQI
jgi:hypothetical protein